jgi:hypothetical protein
MTALLTDTTRYLTSHLGEELRRREGEKLKRKLLRDLVRIADVLAEITLSTWMWVRETLEEEGFEGEELTQHCRVLLEGIDGSTTGYEQLLTLADASGLTPEAAGLGDLEAKVEALREARPQVVGALELVKRPRRPVDETVLAESKAAIERGEFVTIDDDYLARLRAGEDF